jgi:hypothetical protein
MQLVLILVNVEVLHEFIPDNGNGQVFHMGNNILTISDSDPVIDDMVYDNLAVD